MTRGWAEHPWGGGLVMPLFGRYKGSAMGQALAETYARRPDFYSGTFCCNCRAHFPVGADGEFVWVDDGSKVGT